MSEFFSAVATWPLAGFRGFLPLLPLELSPFFSGILSPDGADLTFIDYLACHRLHPSRFPWVPGAFRGK